MPGPVFLYADVFIYDQISKQDKTNRSKPYGKIIVEISILQHKKPSEEICIACAREITVKEKLVKKF